MSDEINDGNFMKRQGGEEQNVEEGISTDSFPVRGGRDKLTARKETDSLKQTVSSHVHSHLR